MTIVNPAPSHHSTLAQRIERSIEEQGSSTTRTSSPRKNGDLIKNILLKPDKNLETLHPTSYVLVEKDPSFFQVFGEPIVDIHYEIISELGKGTFGRVYLVKHRSSGEYVMDIIV